MSKVPAITAGVAEDGVAVEPARFEATDSRGGAVLRFSGRLDASAAAGLWTDVLRAARQAKDRALVLDLAALTVCDTAGATLLLEAERSHGGAATIRGAEARVAAVIALVRPVSGPPAPRPPGPVPSWREVILAGIGACTEGLAYLGEVAVASFRLPLRRRMFRFGDLLRIADQAGVQAIPLVLLLGVLIGLILAFQSLVPMRRFGADIYVANLVALGLLRELGPLLTAVVLSGRSGSSFAAEIGTMKVNQELDAMATMGIDAMTMLVLPRLLAATLIMPVLTVIMELAGLLGMTLVLAASGIPPVAVANQVAYAVGPPDFYGGLFKAALFGAAVAAIGCRAGLGTGVGPRAVGLSATSAVVGGIVAAIAIDGLLAVIFYRLGL
jgi:phospholipid/cholesterol/gamma-HCH transport system permease protein